MSLSDSRRKTMMKKRTTGILAAVLAALLCINLAAAPGLLPEKVYADTQRQAIVNATSLNVRSGPGTEYVSVKRLDYGTAVTVIGETRGADNVLWYRIRFASGTQTMEGYASSAYIKFPTSYTYDSSFENYMNQQGFPESYKDSLRTLHSEHPSWIFQAHNTGLDWNDVIANEGTVGANLVANTSISSWKSTEYGAYDWNTGKWTGFDGATWVAASKDIVCYYMDPRNFLNDIYVFQFLLHTYDSSRHTKEGLQSLVDGTFLDSGASVGGGQTGQNEGQTTPSNENHTQPGGDNGPGGSVGMGGNNNSGGGSMSGGQGGPEYGPGYGTTQTTLPSGGPGSSGSEGSGTTRPPFSGTGSGVGQDVSQEGPAASVSERKTYTAALPEVEYGPGMNASVITGDNTGAGTTSPVPSGGTYVDIIMNAAAQSGVNPYVLGAMIIQEQGAGRSGSISGTTAGYEGYYNFFNVGAYDTGDMSAVTRGLWFASQTGSYGRPWNSIEKSIVGGAQYYAENYVKRGQDTFYLKKFNVQGDNLYKHQYMTNIEGAAGEGAKLARAYTDEMKKLNLVFKIPVFRNMPETACVKPTGSGSPNNKLSSLTAAGYTLTPTFSMDTDSYDVIVGSSVSEISVQASAVDSKASVSGAGTISLQSGNNTIKIDVRAENGSVRTYQIHVVRQGSGSSGTTSGSGTSSGGQGGQTSGPGNSSGSQTNQDYGPGFEGNSQPGSTNGQQDGGQPVGPGTSGASSPGTDSGQISVPSGTTSGTSSRPQVELGVGPGGSSSSGTGSTRRIEGTGEGGPSATAATTASQPAATTAPETTAAPKATTAPKTTTAAGSQASLKKGDCNGDGKVTILDLVVIRKHILGENVLSGAQAKAADINGDGKIDSSDVDALQKMILGN